MSKQDDGGPAFPIGSGDMRDPFGISMRDYFAAKAMQSLLIRFSDESIRKYVASTSYAIADDMLAEREES